MWWINEGKYVCKHEYRIIKEADMNRMGEVTNTCYWFQARWSLFGKIPMPWNNITRCDTSEAAHSTMKWFKLRNSYFTRKIRKVLSSTKIFRSDR